MPCDFRRWTVSDVRASEARRYGAEGEARSTPAARNQIRQIRDQQLQAVRRALLLQSDLNYFNRPVRTRMPGGVGGVRSVMTGPYPDSGPGLQPSRAMRACLLARMLASRQIVSFRRQY